MIVRVVRITTLFALTLFMLNACAALPWDQCNAPLRAVLAEFPQYGDVSIAPEFNPKYNGCTLTYTTTDSPEEILAYFAEQFEAHNWEGVPLFTDGGHEILVHRDTIAYGIQIYEGGGGIINGQPVPPDAKMINLSLMDVSVSEIENYEPNADFPRVELSEEELEKFTGEFTTATHVEAVVTLVDGELQLRKPERSANSLIPIAPTRFRIKNFSDAFSVEFEMAGGRMKSMVIRQNYTHFHYIMASGGPERVVLVPLQ